MADTIAVFSPDGMSRNNNAVRRGMREDNDNVGTEEKHPLNIQSRVFFVLQSTILNANGRYSGYVVNPVPDEDVDGTGTNTGFLATFNDDGVYDFIEVMPPPFGQKMATDKMYEGVVVGCTDYDIVPIIATSGCESSQNPSLATLHVGGVLGSSFFQIPISENFATYSGELFSGGVISFLIRPGQKITGWMTLDASYAFPNTVLGSGGSAAVDLYIGLSDSSGSLFPNTSFLWTTLGSGGTSYTPGAGPPFSVSFPNGSASGGSIIGRQSFTFPFVIKNNYGYNFPSSYGTVNRGIILYAVIRNLYAPRSPSSGFGLNGGSSFGYSDGVTYPTDQPYPGSGYLVPVPLP